MSAHTLYQYMKLGMNIEYLRGISSVSMMPDKSLVAFPRLVENLPPNRYSVVKVAEAIKAVLLQLRDLDLEQTRNESAQLLPLLEQMEGYLRENPDPSASFMNDAFADKLVFFVNELAMTLKREAAAKPVTIAAAPGNEPDRGQ